MSAESVVFHPEALEEAAAALAWYQAQSSRAGESFFAELQSAINVICESPRRWPVYDESCRRFPLKRFPYFVIYREKEPVIEVLAVAHGRRRPGYWRERTGI